MNLVFGSNDPGDIERARAWVQRCYGADLELIDGVGAGFQIGVVAATSLVTTASRDGTTVVAIGHVHGPLPGGGDRLTVSLAEWLLGRIEAGLSPTEGLQGQFAVAIVTAAGVTLVTDTAGMRTWFWRADDDRAAFASNLRLLAESSHDVGIDRTFEDFLLIHGFVPGTATVYRGMAAQPAGTSFALTAHPEPVPVPRRTVTPPPTPSSEQATIERLYDEFLAALEMQSTPGVKAGVLLGGFDSALVTAGLVRLGREVETFSFGYEDSSYEQPFVEELARELNIKHHWVRVDKDQVRHGLEHFTEVFNRPTNWPNYVVSTAAACQEMVAAGVGEAFSGDGCDSVFLGYPGTYQRARVVKQLSRLPASVHRGLVGLLARPFLERRLGHPYRVLLGLLRAQARTETARTYLSLRILDEVSLAQLRKDGPPPGGENVDELANRLAAPHSHLPRYRLAYAGKGAISPNKNKMIGSADLSGLTIWSPYMHESLKALAASLPETMMRPEDKTDSAVTGKYILQRMAVDKGLLPREIVYQPKVAAVDAPIDDWYASDLLPTLESNWRHLPFDVDLDYARSLVKPKLTERLFRRYVMIDKVISHAASLLATYGAFTRARRERP